ncbi:membrane protein insertion efficiency factor YidD [Candidatus Latescibacterota bacterium]
MIKKLLLSLITLYQRTLSLYFGGMCRFHPTCSEYAKLSITNDGVLKGLIKSIWRILRCNPLNKGGIDYP